MTSAQSDKVANIAYWIIAAVAVIATALFLLLGVRFHPLLSNSMAPQLPAGSVVITIPAATTDLATGDVVKLPLPTGSGHDYVHRIAEIIPNAPHTTVVTQGDNNSAPDPWALEILSTTTPRVVASIPLLGHISGLTSMLEAQLVLASVVVASMGLVLLRTLRRPRRRAGGPRHRALAPPPS